MTRTPVYTLLVNYNGWRDTIECLESLLRSDYPALRVIVLDNGSRDESITRIRAWAAGDGPSVITSSAATGALVTPPIPKPISVLQIPRRDLDEGRRIDWASTRLVIVECGANLGFAGGNNVAMRYVASQDDDAYVLLLNNDTVVAPEAISNLVATAEAGEKVGAVGAMLLQYSAPDRVETLAGAVVNDWTAMTRLIDAGTPAGVTHDEIQRMDFISGCCMLMSRRVLRDVGLLDERFFLYSEDADYGIRLRQAGLQLLYCSGAHVWHKGGGTAVHRSEFHDYHTVKSILLLVRKHRPWMLPIVFVYSVTRFVLPKLPGAQWRRIRATLRGYADFARETLRLKTATDDAVKAKSAGRA